MAKSCSLKRLTRLLLKTNVHFASPIIARSRPTRVEFGEVKKVTGVEPSSEINLLMFDSRFLLLDSTNLISSRQTHI